MKELHGHKRSDLSDCEYHALILQQKLLAHEYARTRQVRTSTYYRYLNYYVRWRHVIAIYRTAIVPYVASASRPLDEQR